MVDKNFKKILVTLDGTKNSLRGLATAIQLARQTGGVLTGLFVIPLLPISGIHNLASIRKNRQKEAKLVLKKAKVQAARHGIMLKSRIIHGDPGYNIANIAGKYDITVIGSRGHGAAKQFFLGSTSNYVMHTVRKPVLIVK
jgi:nucleotide-binding universal stress UspA family protein